AFPSPLFPSAALLLLSPLACLRPGSPVAVSLPLDSDPTATGTRFGSSLSLPPQLPPHSPRLAPSQPLTSRPPSPAPTPPAPPPAPRAPPPPPPSPDPPPPAPTARHPPPLMASDYASRTYGMRPNEVFPIFRLFSEPIFRGGGGSFSAEFLRNYPP